MIKNPEKYTDISSTRCWKKDIVQNNKEMKGGRGGGMERSKLPSLHINLFSETQEPLMQLSTI